MSTAARPPAADDHGEARRASLASAFSPKDRSSVMPIVNIPRKGGLPGLASAGAKTVRPTPK